MNYKPFRNFGWALFVGAGIMIVISNNVHGNRGNR